MVVWTLAAAWAQDEWKVPPRELVSALDASILTEWQVLRGGALLEQRPVLYPALEDLARPMAALAGVRVDTQRHTLYRDRVATDLVVIDPKGRRRPIELPYGRSLRAAASNPDGDRLALQLSGPDGVELWTWSEGQLSRIAEVRVNPITQASWSWMPDQNSMLVKLVPKQVGLEPTRPQVPTGPVTRDARGAAASSTYEARDLLVDAFDDAQFTWYASSQLAVVDLVTGAVRMVGAPGVYGDVAPSPDGTYALVERLEPPWSHRVVWSQFAHDLEVWTLSNGSLVHTLASVPVADQVPIHGVPTGVRSASWRQSADATLVWLDALDQGDWSVRVPHRDRMMSLAAPFDGKPAEVFRATHRVDGWWWGRDGLLVVQEYERERRWRHVSTVNADLGPESKKPWFDLSRNDRYADPGDPVVEVDATGRALLAQLGTDLFFAGTGSSPEGDRPFLDRRSTVDGRVTRLFRSPADRYERFRGFTDDTYQSFFVLSEAWRSVPNVLLLSGGRKTAGAAGEATYRWKSKLMTQQVDPDPDLRRITKETVTYTRADGVPLSFTLYTPAGWKPGDAPLPTVLHAYPREFSDPATAGQVSGSEQQFLRLAGATPLSFVLHGYAVLDNTTMPVLGDPDTAYDTFVEQLVASAEAAIDEAVRRGVTDRDRVGITGHSHGGLMTATLLAHSDLFRAGIARSGAYNHTIRPFGFQSERRTLWAAQDTYLAMSPVMFAPQLREPILLVHGARDENPGTIPFQSERLFEAIRGSGGTARWLSLPLEGHGYAARESVEHVLAEQIEWFDKYVRDLAPP